VEVYLSDAKMDKHAIGSTWQAKEPGKHTGITLDQDQMAPLYSKTGADLVAACRSNGGGPAWFELEYDAKDLPGQYFSGDVGTHQFKMIQKVKIGGSVMLKPGSQSYWVYINHGPYASA
jgi:hypothetical protein